MNVIMISGRLTKKPELKQTKNGKSIADFSIAINRGVKNEEGEYITDYVNCRVWNKTAENLCNYQDKGDYILVQGRLQNDNYTDKDGNNRYVTYILAENIEFTPKKKAEQKTEPPKQESNLDNWASAKRMEIQQEDLPFFG